MAGEAGDVQEGLGDAAVDLIDEEMICNQPNDEGESKYQLEALQRDYVLRSNNGVNQVQVLKRPLANMRETGEGSSIASRKDNPFSSKQVDKRKTQLINNATEAGPSHAKQQRTPIEPERNGGEDEDGWTTMSRRRQTKKVNASLIPTSLVQVDMYLHNNITPNRDMISRPQGMLKTSQPYLSQSHQQHQHYHKLHHDHHTTTATTLHTGCFSYELEGHMHFKLG